MTDPTADRPAQEPPMPPEPAPFPTAPVLPRPAAFPAPEAGPGGFAALDPGRAPSTAPQGSASVAATPSTPADLSAAAHSADPPGQMTPSAGYTYPTTAYGGAYAGYGVPATGPYVVYQQPKTNGMAVASMVVSIVGAVLLTCYGVGGLLGVVGAVLGHVARRQIRERSDGGDGMAIAGIVVGWVAFGLAIIIIGLFAALIAVALNATPPTPN